MHFSTSTFRLCTAAAKAAQAFCVVAILAVTGSGLSLAQNPLPDGMARGVVWDIPVDFRTAAEDLIEMQAVGVTAVRTGYLRDRRILTLADSLGITFYRELPYATRTAGELRDRADEADSLLTVLATDAERHVSAGPIGLTVLSDTDNTATCEWLADRRAAFRSRAPNLPVYYVSTFDRRDACADVVDFVLVDVLGHPRPILATAAWAGSTPVGIGMLGVPVARDTGADGGARGRADGSRARQGISDTIENTQTPAHQARYLEDVLGTVAGSGLTAVFVYRWRDRSSDPDMADVRLAEPYGRHFGLYDARNNPRPALQVVRGFYRGDRHVFALPVAGAPGRSAGWFLLMGWALILMIGVVYTTSPLMRQMVPRYFLSHGFYRNAVREAREVLPLTSTALMTVIGLTAGMLGTLLLTTFRDSDSIEVMLLRQIPELRAAAAVLLDAPLVLAVLIGSLSLLLMALWITLWMVLVRRRAPILASQALMLAVWPRWPLLVLLPIGMIVFTLEPTAREAGAVLIAFVWPCAELWSSVRTAIDFAKITRVPTVVTLLVWVFNPFVLLLLAAAILAVADADLTGFLIRLATD